jgi:hypothetical protein
MSPGRPIGITHAHVAKAERRNFQIAFSECAFFHNCIPEMSKYSNLAILAAYLIMPLGIWFLTLHVSRRNSKARSQHGKPQRISRSVGQLQMNSVSHSAVLQHIFALIFSDC